MRDEREEKRRKKKMIRARFFLFCFILMRIGQGEAGIRNEKISKLATRPTPDKLGEIDPPVPTKKKHLKFALGGAGRIYELGGFLPTPIHKHQILIFQ